MAAISMASIEARVTAIVSRVAKIPAAELSRTADLRAEFGIDSLLGLTIIATVEKEFDIYVPPEDLDRYTTIRETSELIHQLLR